MKITVFNVNFFACDCFQGKELLSFDIAQYYTTNDELIFESNHIDWRGKWQNNCAMMMIR